MEWSNIWPAASAVVATSSLVYLMLRNLKSDLNGKVGELGTRLDKMDERLDKMDEKLDEIRTDTRGLDVRISHIEGYLVGSRDKTGT